MSLEGNTHLYDRIIDSATKVIDKIGDGMKSKEGQKQEDQQKEASKPENLSGC
jgi:hypothetical protein